jgi:hypothetical protein
VAINVMGGPPFDPPLAQPSPYGICLAPLRRRHRLVDLARD